MQKVGTYSNKFLLKKKCYFYNITLVPGCPPKCIKNWPPSANIPISPPLKYASCNGGKIEQMNT